MNRLSLALVLFLSASMVYSQRTPTSEIPVNEGVCDELMWATPGLFGLCVAFCEAQDCEPDFSLLDPFETCNPSNPKLLEIYNKKKQPSDPQMPCFLPACPCFNEEEVREITPPWSEHPDGEWIGCSEEGNEIFIWHDSSPIGDWWRTAWVVEDHPRFGNECFYDKYLGGPFPDNYIVRLHSRISIEETKSCQDLIIRWINENGGCEGNTEIRKTPPPLP